MRKGGAMKSGIWLAIFLAFFVQSAFAQKLNDLIKQNVYDVARPSYKQYAVTEQQQATPRLWIHVRSREQQKAVMGIMDRIKSVNLNGRPLEVRPIKLVSKGPNDSQLYFYRKQDKDDAELLLKELQKLHPQIRLQDYSDKYKGLEAANAGHYELWFAPDATKFNTP